MKLIYLTLCFFLISCDAKHIDIQTQEPIIVYFCLGVDKTPE